MSMDWREALWAELDAQDPVTQIMTTAEWTAYITRELLPALGVRRREKVVEVLAQPGWDATRLAETVGGRRTTFTRLNQEGKAVMREARHDLPAAA